MNAMRNFRQGLNFLLETCWYGSGEASGIHLTVNASGVFGILHLTETNAYFEAYDSYTAARQAFYTQIGVG